MTKNILLIIISIIAFELVLRFSLHSGGQASAIYDSQIGYWHKSNFTSQHTRNCYNTEYSFGEYGEIKPHTPYSPDKQKITILGNSYIEAAMVDNKNVLHNALSKSLNSEYDVLNFGLYGSNLFHQALIYLHKVPQYNEKHVFHFVNFIQALDYDAKKASPLSRQLVEGTFKNGKIIPQIQRDYNAIEKVRDSLGYTEFYEHTLTSIAHIKSFLEEKKPKFHEKQDAELDTIIMKKDRSPQKWNQLKSGIKFLHHEAQTRGSQYVAVVYSGNAFRKTNLVSKFTSWLKQEQIPYIDLDDEIKTFNFIQYGYTCDFHWNDDVHQAIGKVLATYLRSEANATAHF